MNWIELSYAYIFTACRRKKLIPGVKTFLHEDTISAYQFMETVIQKYRRFPTSTHFLQKFNLDETMYLTDYSLKELADFIKNEYIKFKVSETTKELHKLIAKDEVPETTKFLEPMHRLFSAISNTNPIRPVKLSEYRKVLKHYMNEDAEVHVCDYGIESLDRFTGGIHEAQYIIIYANTSEGKSTLARHVAGRMAEQGKLVLYITLEESARKSVIKTLSTTIQFAASDAFDQRLDAKTWQKIKRGMRDVKGDVLFQDVLESRTVTELARLCNQYEPDVIILDQIPLFTPGGDPDWKVITKVTRELKQFTQDHKIPMIALTQATRKNKKEKPSLEDSMGLAYSIGQDADTVLFLHPTDRDGDANRKKITLVKNRDRERFQSFDLRWDIGRGVVEDISRTFEVAKRPNKMEVDEYAEFDDAYSS